MTGPDGNLSGIQALGQDVTERNELEARLKKAQKLESLGLVAGGISHEYNNMLQGILGYADLALLDLPSDSLTWSHVNQIKNIGQKAARLTRKCSIIRAVVR